METDPRCGSRTVVVSGVPGPLAAGRMADKLTIHFQSRRRSRGGDVEAVRYPTDVEGVAYVTFDNAEDAEEVVRKEQQIMTDEEFPQDYLLTVFPFTRDVFMYVPSAKVDLSVFGSDQASLIQSLRLTHRSLRFQPELHQRRATVEGPFAAVKALREDLIHRASRLKSTVPAPTAAAVGLRESVFNPRVISYQEFLSSVSFSGSNAKREPAGSNSLWMPLQSTGEATKVQSLLSSAKTQNISSRQKVSPTVGSFNDTYSVEEEKLGARSTLTKYRTTRTNVNPRQVFGEQISTGIRSSLSGLDLVPAEKISAKQPGVEDISQKNTLDGKISATKIRGENHLSSDQSSSVVTDKLQRTGLKDVSAFSKSNAEDEEESSDLYPGDPQDTCIWVDSYTFRYLEKFDKEALDRCLKGLTVSVECVRGTDLTRISLTDKQTPETALRIQQASEDLRTLVACRMLILRVHQISYKENQKQKLIQICSDLNSPFDNVLYMLEDSCVTVVGPLVSSHLFYRRLVDRLNSKTFL